MATLKVEYMGSGTEWYLDVAKIRAGAAFRVPAEQAKHPWQSFPWEALVHDGILLSTGDPDGYADLRMPDVVHQGAFHPSQCDDDALLLVVWPGPGIGTDPYGVVVPHRFAYLMNDRGDTIDRI